MKKILMTIAIAIGCSTAVDAQRHHGSVGIDTGTDTIRATLHVHGTMRADTIPSSADPAYAVVLDRNDSILYKVSIDSLALFLSKLSRGYPDIIGWGYSTLSQNGNINPSISFFKDSKDKIVVPRTNGVSIFTFQMDTLPIQERDATLDWSTVTYLPNFYIVGGAAVLNGYLYVAMRYQSTSERRVYRYDKNNLSAGATLMTFSGLSFLDGGEPVMTSNGKDFYFSYNAGNSSSDNIIAQYKVSGTTFTYVSSKTMGAAGDFSRSFLVDSTGNYYGLSSSGTRQIKKFSTTGALVRSSSTLAYFLMNWSNQLYFLSNIIEGYFEKFNK